MRSARPARRRAARKFTIIDDIDPALKRRYEAFLAANDIEVAGIEFIRDADGAVYTYDVNTNTNYNPDAEARAGRSAMTALARYLGAELRSSKQAGSPEHDRPKIASAALAMTGRRLKWKQGLLRLHDDQQTQHGSVHWRYRRP